MRQLPALIIALSLVLCPLQGHAAFNRENAPWPVIVDGDTLALPFWGGINSPKPSLADFDGDGLVDLFLGETKGKVSYLRNTGSATAPLWTPVTQRLGDLNTRTWHRLADIDADGDLDMFCDAGNFMTAYYQNVSSGPNITFTFEVDTFGVFETGVNNTGDFIDLDDDGDLDFFLGSVTGELWQYRNDGNPVNPSYVLASTFYDSVFAFPGGFASSVNNPQHGFSTITFADYDSDGDGDLFWGDINNNNAYLFGNLGTPSVSDLTEQTESYLPVNTLGLNHTAFADLDDDNDADMIVGAANGDDINNLILLRNIGTPGVPSYTVENSNLIEEIDVGSYAIPTFGNLDGDGDQDLIIGRGDGRLTFFQNTGSAAFPVFTRASDFYKSIDVGLSAAPVLVDWDADGDLDLLIGNELGRIEYWRNDGSAINFNPVKITGQLAGIQVDILATPFTVDWNSDGLVDLLVGEWDFNGLANVLLYQNIGPANSPNLSLVTNRLLKRVPRDFTTPRVYDWDCDARKDLIVGGRLFGMTLYRNTASIGTFPDSLTLVEQATVLPGIDDGYRMAFSLLEIDADLDRDVFVGEEDGGLNFYRNDGTSCSCLTHGDGDASGAVDIVDVGIAINIAFRGSPNVSDAGCCPHTSRLDYDCSCVVDIVDVGLIINRAFRGGPPACNPCQAGNQCPR